MKLPHPVQSMFFLQCYISKVSHRCLLWSPHKSCSPLHLLAMNCHLLCWCLTFPKGDISLAVAGINRLPLLAIHQSAIFALNLHGPLLHPWLSLLFSLFIHFTYDFSFDHAFLTLNDVKFCWYGVGNVSDYVMTCLGLDGGSQECWLCFMDFIF